MDAGAKPTPFGWAFGAGIRITPLGPKWVLQLIRSAGVLFDAVHPEPNLRPVYSGPSA